MCFSRAMLVCQRVACTDTPSMKSFLNGLLRIFCCWVGISRGYPHQNCHFGAIRLYKLDIPNNWLSLMTWRISGYPPWPTWLRKPPNPLHDLHPFRHVAAHQLHQALLWGQDVEALASDQTTNALVGPWTSETGYLLGCNQLCVYPYIYIYICSI